MEPGFYPGSIFDICHRFNHWAAALGRFANGPTRVEQVGSESRNMRP